MVAPVFIDAAGAAEMLRVPVETVLDLIAQGRLKTYGGRAANPFVRSADVALLAEEVSPPADAPQTARRVRGAVSRVQTRLTADARWADLSEDDIREWARRADALRRQAARTAAGMAIARLQTLLQALDEVE
jgi:hypothetical protein